MSNLFGLSLPSRFTLKGIPGQRKPAPSRSGEAWTRLQEGNRRWSSGRSSAAAGRDAHRRAELVDGQTPFAAVLSCSDSRVPPEILFDQGLGDLFVIRTAGHAVDDAVLGSLEYAVAVLGVDLVLVLGHEKCGAIKAAAQTLETGAVPGGYIREVVARLTVDMAHGQNAGLVGLDELTQWHADSTSQLLKQRSQILGDAVQQKGLGVLAATYELGTGRVLPVRANLTTGVPS
ncbi:hypothetical protein LWF15_13425 [Kineosporia rhizophila]|nr:carbonic anhydrase [Kineosporia sp. NBRC 101677]MCE0536512.1 hypothetical protein [Kineosporia rhizophila]